MKIIDLHCDTIAKLMEDKQQLGLKQNVFSIDIEKLKKGQSLGQFFALFIDKETVDDSLLQAKKMLNLFYKEINDNQAEICSAKNIIDLAQNQKDNKISAFLSIEEGGVLQGQIENLQEFYQLGVRLITLTWNYPNELGYPNYEYKYQNYGLTEFGKECVREMNRLGMIVDVSHLSDQGFYDVAQISTKPFVASHSNCRTICNHSRNLTDDMIKVLAQNGGIMGINFAAHFLGKGDFGTIDDMINHIKHIYKIGGIDTIAIGSDFDGISTEVEIIDFSKMQKLIDALKDNGFTESEIEKIAFKNVMRILKECLI